MNTKITIPARGIYAITDGQARHLVARVGQALAGGAAMIQYRDLTDDTARRADEARAIAELCHRHDVPLIIDHDVALAVAVGADGVHLSQADGTPVQVREVLGPETIVGVSCYASAELVRKAAAEGASYVSLGAFFPSPTKPAAGRAPLELLQETEGLGIARVAIGGVTADNGRLLVDAGAEFLATVSAVFGAEDPRAAAEHLASFFHA